MTYWDRLRRINDRVREEDPEDLLDRAQAAMMARHKANRERAVVAITQKNNLADMLQDIDRKVAAIGEALRAAHAAGDEVQVSQRMKERDNYALTRGVTEAQFEIAVQTADQIKDHLKHGEENIRRKTAEALVLRAQWQRILVEQDLARSLAQMSAQEQTFDFTSGDAARAQIAARQRQNRERVAHAIGHRCALERLVAEERAMAARLRSQTDACRRNADTENENALLRRLEQQEATLSTTEAALRQATEVTDRARALLEAEASHLHAALLLDAASARRLQKRAHADDPRRPSRLLRTAALIVLAAILLLWLWLGA